MSSYKIEIVAEVANAHQGDPETALKIASAAADAGADAVKFQLYSGPELLVRSHPRFEHFSKQAFSESEWEQIFAMKDEIVQFIEDNDHLLAKK